MRISSYAKILLNVRSASSSRCRGEGVFAPRPDLSLPVPEEEDACALDVGALGAGSDELLLITPHGVLAQSFRGRTAGPQRKLLEQPTLYHQPIPGELPRLRVVQDL